jgi:hypothetical protein
MFMHEEIDLRYGIITGFGCFELNLHTKLAEACQNRLQLADRFYQVRQANFPFSLCSAI